MDARKSSFETLECWKAARALKDFIRQAIRPKLPKHEQYDLADQLRAGRTVDQCEYCGRLWTLPLSGWAKFLSNARGSTHEVLDHLIEAYDEEYITDAQLREARQYIDETLRLINGYRAYLLKRTQRRSAPPHSTTQLQPPAAPLNSAPRAAHENFSYHRFL